MDDVVDASLCFCLALVILLNLTRIYGVNFYYHKK